MTFTESTIEQAAKYWIKELGHNYAYDGERPERVEYQETLLPGRLQEAIPRINQDLAQEEALRRITRLGRYRNRQGAQPNAYRCLPGMRRAGKVAVCRMPVR